MEDSNYWMWRRRKLDGSPHLPEDNDSWEEQAFAEDSAGDLGGCIWPPKSYSCSFCRREFRSAQALGGHMNVHRRDRARLKLSSEIEECSHLHHQQDRRHPSPRPPLADQRSSHVDAAAYSSSSKPNGFHGVVASTPSRVSVESTQENSTEHILISSSCSSSLVKGNRTGSLLSFPPSRWDQFSLRILAVPELILGTDDLKTKERGCAEKKVAGKEDEGEATSTKRRRIDGSIPFIVPSSLGDGSSVRSELLGVGPRPIEELDLELRLGDRPMIK